MEKGDEQMGFGHQNPLIKEHKQKTKQCLNSRFAII